MNAPPSKAQFLAALIRSEYEQIAVDQEMQRQRGAVELFEECRKERVAYTNHDWDEDQRIDGRRE